jgi:hypothetical protein
MRKYAAMSSQPHFTSGFSCEFGIDGPYFLNFSLYSFAWHTVAHSVTTLPLTSYLRNPILRAGVKIAGRLSDTAAELQHHREG